VAPRQPPDLKAPHSRIPADKYDREAQDDRIQKSRDQFREHENDAPNHQPDRAATCHTPSRIHTGVSGSAPSPSLTPRDQPHPRSRERGATARAALQLIRITDVSRVAAHERRSARRSLATPATLRAMICDRIVPDDVLPVTLIDVSETGCAVITNDRRVRVRDRLWLYARFLEGKISTEIRVARTSADLTAITVGCVFLDPGPDAAVMNTVWSRLQERP
jgi:hypothetical protein